LHLIPTSFSRQTSVGNIDELPTSPTRYTAFTSILEVITFEKQSKKQCAIEDCLYLQLLVILFIAL